MKFFKVFFAAISMIALGIAFYACSTAPVENNGSSTSSPGGSISASGVYVATNGSDANDGTNKSAPVKSIQTAIDRAVSLGMTNVFVAEGVYFPGSGLKSMTNGIFITNNNLNILGGFSADYAASTGKSILDGTNGLYHIIRIEQAANIQLNGFIIKSGNANGSGYNSEGGGIFVFNSSYNLITNTIFYSNNASSFGGAMYFLNSSGNIIAADVISNSASQGSGLFMDNGSDSNRIHSLFAFNNTTGSGGGIYFNVAHYNTVRGNIISNTASSYGGGIYCSDSPTLITNAAIQYNSASQGGGIYCLGESSFISSSFLLSNTANSGGGMYFYNAAGILSGNLIGFNLAVNYGGGIYLNNSPFQIISNAIIKNQAADAGGGIYSAYSSPLISYNSILSNNGGSWGEGILFDHSTATNYGNIICENYFNAIGFVNCEPGLVLISNLIGCGSVGGYAIRMFAETSNYVLRYNLFVTNKMSLLLYNNNAPGLAVTNNSDWVNINNTNRTLAEPGSTNNGSSCAY
jgi:predicted outer membrane repeat protein